MKSLDLLEVVLKDAIGNDSLSRPKNSAQYLAALGGLAHALSRQQSAVFEVEVCDELAAQAKNKATRESLDVKRNIAAHDLALAELEVKLLTFWTHVVSGVHWRRSVAANALTKLAEEIRTTEAPLFSKEGEQIEPASPETAEKVRASLRELFGKQH